jgi:hypothetical protein
VLIVISKNDSPGAANAVEFALQKLLFPESPERRIIANNVSGEMWRFGFGTIRVPEYRSTFCR